MNSRLMLLLLCLLAAVLSMKNILVAQRLDEAVETTKILIPERWSEEAIGSYLSSHSSRAYFSRLFRDGGFRSGLEVGVADGRFSEHFLVDNIDINWTWNMVEPFPNAQLLSRMGVGGTWQRAGLLQNVKTRFFSSKSLETSLLDQLPEVGFDLIYLDGDHRHEVIKRELPIYWNKVKSGGIMAGHDYCNYGEPGLKCNGCDSVPQCREYTSYGLDKGKKGRAANQHGVVMAVHEWLNACDDKRLKVQHTKEDFTRESLGEDGMDYDIIITNTRNPSWYIIKP